MIRNIFFIILFFALFRCNTYNKKSYIDYYKAVHQAESLIYDLDYNEALTIYKEIFSSYPHAFYKDLYNACLCALKLKDYPKAFELANALVAHGYELKDFEEPAFDNFRISEYWPQFMDGYDKIRSGYLTGLDMELRNKHLELSKIDQSKDRVNGTNIHADSIFYMQALQIVDLIKDKGFPHWFINKDSINDGIMAMFGHDCILYNFLNEKTIDMKGELYSEVENSKVLDTVRYYLKEAVYEGWLLPQDYTEQISFKSRYNPYGKLIINLNYKEEIVSLDFNFSENEISKINQRRDSIGLSPVSREAYINYINKSKYKDYPFKEIKEKLSEPYPFNDLPFVIKLTMIENEFVNDNIKDGTEYFMLTTLLGAQSNVFYLDLEQ